MRTLIIGAGIAGLSAYRALAARGLPARLIERDITRSASGAGMFLPGNSVRALTQLNVLEPLLRAAWPIRRQHFYDSRGAKLNSVDTDGYWSGIGPCLGIKRARLWQILKDGVPDEHIEHGTVTGIAEARHITEVTFGDGSREEYDLVIGADGINSTIRRMTFPAAEPPQYRGFLSWRYLAPNIGGIEDWTVVLGEGRCVLAVPVSSNEVYVYADMAVDEARVGGFSAGSDLAALFSDVAGPVGFVLPFAQGNEVHFGKVMQLSAANWISGRTVLIGDAAHASSPSMAQAAALAAEDGIVLADELAGNADVETALRRFELRRRPRVDWVQRQNHVRDRMRLLPRGLRNPILRLGGSAIYARSYRPLKERI